MKSNASSEEGEASYPMSLGAHCAVWDGMSCKEEEVECKKPWCFVDPCKCRVKSREHPLWQGTSWQGRPVYMSSATCSGTHGEGQIPSLSFCKKESFNEEVLGRKACKCIGLSGSRGTVSVNISGDATDFPVDLGSSCHAWDERHHPDCLGEDPPGWCHRSWCFVDPCACAIHAPPKVSAYFPKATYGRKPVYYSYETCGSSDTYTLDSHSACVNQATEAKCLAVSADPDDPELRKCAWGGPEIKCLGKELLHTCQVSEETWNHWSWWSYYRDLPASASLTDAAHVVTACIFSLLMAIFICTVRKFIWF